jgi:hypothetical protein
MPFTCPLIAPLVAIAARTLRQNFARPPEQEASPAAPTRAVRYRYAYKVKICSCIRTTRCAPRHKPQALVPNLANAPARLCLGLAGWIGLCLYISLLDRIALHHVPPPPRRRLVAGPTATVVIEPTQ